MAVTFQQIREAADFVRSRLGSADIGIVLGSGLGGFTEELTDADAVSYGEIPHFPESTAPGHAGRWWRGTLAGKRVYMLQGRIHFYEGRPLDETVMYVRMIRYTFPRKRSFSSSS